MLYTLAGDWASAAALALLFALAFHLSYRPSGYFSFLVPLCYLVAAHTAASLARGSIGSLLVAATLGIAVAIVVAAVGQGGLLEALWRKSQSRFIPLAASWVLLLIAESLLTLVLGGRHRMIRQDWLSLGEPAVWSFGQQVGITLSLVIALIWGVAERRGTFFLALNALSENPHLAGLRGVPRGRVVLVAAALSGAVAGASGIALALDIDVGPGFGLQPLVTGFVVYALAGRRPVLIRLVASAAGVSGLSTSIGFLLGGRFQSMGVYSLMILILLLGRRHAWSDAVRTDR